MNVIQISGRLHPRPSETLKCREGFFVSILTHVPSGTFGHQVDLDADEDGWNRRGGEDDTPLGIGVACGDSYALENNAGDVSKHDAEGGPHLPLHCQGAANFWWSAVDAV